MTEKTLPVKRMRRGMVRIMTKGSAREKGLILTTQRTARHTSWITVKKCIRNVFTCKKGSTGESEQKNKDAVKLMHNIVKLFDILIYLHHLGTLDHLQVQCFVFSIVCIGLGIQLYLKKSCSEVKFLLHYQK